MMEKGKFTKNTSMARNAVTFQEWKRGKVENSNYRVIRKSFLLGFKYILLAVKFYIFLLAELLLGQC